MRAYLRPRVAAMLALGVSAGLPNLLVFATLTAWLRDAGVERASIGLFGWIGTVFSLKVLWAPAVDRLRIPVLGRLGRRRSWMLVGQAIVGIGLFALSGLDPAEQLGRVAALTLLVAIGSATQDIAVDAWRIEAEAPSLQGAMAAAYVAGYRVAMLASGAGALLLADTWGWPAAYRAMAGLAALGPLTTLLAPEPDAVVRAGPWWQEAVVAPFTDFFARHGREAAALLALAALFKLPDGVIAGMTNPLLLDLGYDKAVIAAVAKGIGFAATLAGAATGGLVVARWGPARPLPGAAVVLAASNLAFAGLAWWGRPDVAALAVANGLESFAGGVATAALVAWLSSLTSPGRTATQYALLSALMTLPAKVLSGGAGLAVDAWGYPRFFVATAALGLPGWWLARRVAR